LTLEETRENAVAANVEFAGGAVGSGVGRGYIGQWLLLIALAEMTKENLAQMLIIRKTMLCFGH
jgi:hypothetical protein